MKYIIFFYVLNYSAKPCSELIPKESYDASYMPNVCYELKDTSFDHREFNNAYKFDKFKKLYEQMPNVVITKLDTISVNE